MKAFGRNDAQLYAYFVMGLMAAVFLGLAVYTGETGEMAAKELARAMARKEDGESKGQEA